MPSRAVPLYLTCYPLLSLKILLLFFLLIRCISYSFFFAYCFLEIISFILLCLFVLYFRVLRTTSPWLPQEQKRKTEKISYKIKESKTRDTFCWFLFRFLSPFFFFNFSKHSHNICIITFHISFISYFGVLCLFLFYFILFITNCNISPMHF